MTKQTDGWRDFAKRWRTCAALIAASVLLILTQGVGFAQVAISAAPATVNLVAGGTAAFSAIVTGSAVTGVTWSLSPSLGTISAAGVYTAPSVVTQNTTVIATATSQANPAETAWVTIQLYANGIYFTTNSEGLQSVVFNGTNYNWVYGENLMTVLQIQPPGGSVTQAYDPVCSGTFTSTSVSQNCSAGSDSFALNVAYSVPSAYTIQAQITFTNNSPTDTVALAGISTLGVQAPFIASTPSSQVVSAQTPVVTVNYGTGQFATWTATPGTNVDIVETCGWTNVCKNATQLTNIAPGQTATATVLLRFTVNAAETTVALAPEAFTSFSNAYPYLVNWPDRRPIYAWFMSDYSHQSAINPRGYLDAPTMNVSNIPAFTAAVLAQTQSIITSIQAASVKPQGIIVWDVEGEEFVQPTSYIGDPRVLGEGYAPEMNATADLMFAMFKNAGLKVGVTLRPDYLQWGPLANLPSTCNSSTSTPGYDDYYIAVDQPFQAKFNACYAPNTWTPVSTGNGWQTMYQSTQEQQVINLLLAKVAYANARWGTTLYYVDSTVWNGGATMTADIFRALITAYPNSLFIPEQSYLGTLAVAMPYATPNGSLPAPYSPATWRYAYPNGGQVTNMSNCSGSSTCWSTNAQNFYIGQRIGDIAMYSVPQQLSSSELEHIESMIIAARNNMGTVIATDSSTGSSYTFTGTPATIHPPYPVKMRVYFADVAQDLAASTAYCENGSWLGTNSCTMNLAGLRVAQIRYYDFGGNLVLSETPGPL